MDDMIAGTTLIGIWPNGQESRIEVTFGKPYFDENAWICWTGITGLDTKPCKTYGVDSLQALLLAMCLAESQLSTFVAIGGQLLHPDGREPILVEFIFPKLKPQ